MAYRYSTTCGTMNGTASFSRQYGSTPDPSCKAQGRLLCGLRREFSMRVDNELFGNTAVELRVAVRRLVQGDDGGTDSLRDLYSVTQDGLHQTSVVLHDRALPRGEGQ